MNARLLSVLLLLAAPPFAAGEPVVERAAAGRVNATGRDACFMISEDGDSLVAFVPEGKHGWSRQLYVSVGPGVAAFALADFDGDGRLDLAVARLDRRFAIWRGDGEGHFDLKFNSRRELPWVPAALEAVAAGRSPPDLIATRINGERLQLRNDGFAVFGRERPLAAAAPPEPMNSIAFALDASGRSAALTPAGRIVFADPAGLATRELRLPFAIRAAAVGDFDGDGIPDLAVAGYGARPAFALIPGNSPGGAAAPALPELPTAGCNVSVAAGPSFSPNACTVNVGDAVNWSGLAAFHTVTSINAACTDACNGKFCSPAGVSTYSHTFAAGEGSFYKCNPHCGLGMTGTITVNSPPASPGTVPDTGTPFKIKKNGTVSTNLDLTWGASCGAATTNYEIYQGTLPIGGTYSHTMLNCSLGNVTAATVTPGAGSTYYLLVPRSASQEGSYGKNSAGAQIPAATTGQCVAQNLTGAC